MAFANGGELQMIPVDDLVLDQSNPRIARLLEIYGGNVTPEQMELALRAEMIEGDGSATGNSETTYHSLMVSIQTNRGIIHPIIVNDCDEGKVVIEGNTRTMIYHTLNEREPDANWSTIRCLVYQNLPQEDIDAIRLQAHLVGPRQWNPYSKAKYLSYLRNSQHLTWEQVVDFCGGERNQARTYVDAYGDMEEYYRPIVGSDDQFDPGRFSSFAELQKPSVAKALLDHGFDKSDFARWVHDRLIDPQSTVRSLPAILGDEKARSVFLKDGAKAGLKEIDTPSPDEVIRDATLRQLAEEIARRILLISYEEFRKLRADVGSSEVMALIDARDALTQLCGDIARE